MLQFLSGSKFPSLSCPESNAEALDNLPETSGSVIAANIRKASLYMDATLSMQGFVSKGTDTRYARIISVLETALNSFGNPEIAHYWFGKSAELLPSIVDYSDAKKPEFYQKAIQSDQNNFSETLLQTIIQNTEADQNRLSVIVTDLYQDEGELKTKVAKAINNKYLSKDLALGIIAHKSEFSGEIYDVGKSEYKFDYGKDSLKYRPFYVLVLGSSPAVKQYFDTIKNTKTAQNAKIDQAQFILFSRKITPNIARIDRQQRMLIETSTKPQLTKERFRRVDLSVDGIKVPNGPILRTRQQDANAVERILVSPLNNTINEIAYETKFTTYDYLPRIKFEFQPRQKEFQTAIENKKYRGFVQSSSANIKQALEVQDWKIDESKAKFTAKLDTEKLKPGVYRFDIKVIADRFIAESWWKDWSNSSGREIYLASRGDQTFELESFLDELGRMSLNDSQSSTVAELCFIVKRE